MVSRRNFFAVTAVMAIICFMFQALNVAKEYWNDYEVNAYAQDTSKLPGKEELYRAVQEDGEHPLIVCIGDSEEASIVSWWALYAKWDFQSYSSLEEYEKAQKAEKASKPRLMVTYAESLNFADDTEKLKSYVEEGLNVVFATLPDVKIIREQPGLRELLGIERVVKNSTTTDGIHLYQGFLLGGETIYQASTEEEEKNQDMELTFPWYDLASATKVYMKGIPKDDSVKTEEYPVLIWRKSFGESYVFAVNGDYMKDSAALGMLTGMVNEINTYTVYPVVNAQNLVVVNYPGMAEENEEKMQQLYSRSMRSVFRDVIWPSIAAVQGESSLGLSCMMAPQFDYSDSQQPFQGDLPYYMRVINEQNGETGLSAYSVSSTNLWDKLEEDAQFMDVLPEYRFSSFYGADRTEEELQKALKHPLLKNIRTVIEPYDEECDILNFKTDQVTSQKMIIDGYDHTYRNDFKVKSIESALGYTGILLDLEKVAYPEGDGDSWEKLSEKFAANTSTYWKNFEAFDGTTVSESDNRVRSFLSLDYAEERKGDKIFLKKMGTEETVWFILRTHNEAVKEVKGGTFKELEEGAWLIQAEDEKIVITMEPSDESYYYE